MICKPIVVLIVILLQAQFAQSQSPQFQNFIEQYLISFPNNVEVAIGIVDGENTYKMGYRLENGKLIPVNNEATLFEIGSITKVFTSALLMREAKRNTIALNDPIQRHLTFQIKQDTYKDQSLSILHLMTHTSGLKRNPIMGYDRYSRYLKSFELTYVPGKKWEYNNLTIALAGKLIAEKTGASWDVLLKDYILKPLNMTSTYAHLGEAPKANRVKCVNKKGETGDCYFHRLGEFQWPNGGIISNVNDLLKWLQANLDRNDADSDLDFIQDSHDPLGDTISTVWFRKYNATQGIAWWHYRTESNERIICHGGNMPAQTSFIAFDKGKNRGIIILTNVGGRSLMNDDQIMKTTDLSVRLLGL